jgi:protein-S-isoprenylcysteine O-methyltransferase Ste14
MEIMMFEKNYWVGRAIALVGMAVLLVSVAQMFWSKHKGAEIVETGLYSRIRHPQITGMLIMTLGLAVMVLTLSYFPILDAFQHASLWLLQALCYIAIAKYEDQKLAKKFGENYRQYQQKVPFLFPRKNPKRIPETLYTVLIAVLIWVLLLVFLPFYQFIRIT